MEETARETRLLIIDIHLLCSSRPTAHHAASPGDAVAAGHETDKIGVIGNGEIEEAHGGDAGVGIDHDIPLFYGGGPENARLADAGIPIVYLCGQTLVTKHVQSEEGEGALLLIAIDIDVLAVYKARIRCPPHLFLSAIRADAETGATEGFEDTDGALEIIDG